MDKSGDAAADPDADLNIMARSDLHCAFLFHWTIETIPRGRIRFNFDPFNDSDHLTDVIRAGTEIDYFRITKN
jgi:hypothetical protein